MTMRLAEPTNKVMKTLLEPRKESMFRTPKRRPDTAKIRAGIEHDYNKMTDKSALLHFKPKISLTDTRNRSRLYGN